MRNSPLKDVPLLRLTVCLMAGIVVGDAVAVSQAVVLAMMVAVVLTALLLGRMAIFQSVAIVVSCVLLGVWLTVRRQAQLKVSWPDGRVAYEAVVLSEPVEKPRTVAVDILLTQSRRKLKCYVSKDARSRCLRVGDGLRICSRIRPNSQWRRGTFDYRRYLEVHGFSGQTYVAARDWTKAAVSLRTLSRFERTRLFFLRERSLLLNRLKAGGLAGEDYAVVAAMALGDKSALSAELKDVYSLTGASHVLALSGLHLGIIYSLLTMLIVGRRWRTVSQVLILVTVWGYVLLVGMPVSVVRSAIMLSVYALLSLGHRDRMSVNTLAFTAIVLLMENPYALYDVGFQMSFLAVFSILVWMPLLMGVFSDAFLQSHRLIRWVWGMVCLSLAAQLGVAPLIAYYFGRFSTCFLLTNFIVIPSAMLILCLAPVVLLFPSLAYLLIYIVGLLNTVLLYIASWPGACIDGLQPSALQVSMVYVIIAAVYLLVSRFTYSRASAGYR